MPAFVAAPNVIAPATSSGSPPADDRADPLDAVVLAKIGAPSACAHAEVFPRFRPPSAKAARVGAPDLIVDED